MSGPSRDGGRQPAYPFDREFYERLIARRGEFERVSRETVTPEQGGYASGRGGPGVSAHDARGGADHRRRDLERRRPVRALRRRGAGGDRGDADQPSDAALGDPATQPSAGDGRRRHPAHPQLRRAAAQPRVAGRPVQPAPVGALRRRRRAHVLRQLPRRAGVGRDGPALDHRQREPLPDVRGRPGQRRLRLQPGIRRGGRPPRAVRRISLLVAVSVCPGGDGGTVESGADCGRERVRLRPIGVEVYDTGTTPLGWPYT